MKKRGQKREKLNNAGMTLVEILVAMFILSAAIVPMMYGFVQIARYSAHGRSLQQTTGMAQTVMENCKAYRVEDIQELMKTPEPSATPGPRFLTADYAATAVYHLADVPPSPVPGAPADDGTYRYCATDIYIDNEEYGFELTMKPIAAAQSTTMLDYENKNEKLDAIFMENATKYTDGGSDYLFSEFEERAIDKALEGLSEAIKNKTAAAPINQETIVPVSVLKNQIFEDAANQNYGIINIERSIVLVAGNANGTGSDTVKINYVYHFGLVSGKKYKMTIIDPTTGTSTNVECDWGGSDIEASTSGTEIYSNSASNGVGHPTQLENVYLYYFPAYSGSFVGYPCTKDSIQIRNDRKEADGVTSIPLNLYLIKQKHPVLSDTLLSIEETNYDLQVNIASGSVIMHHNLKKNLGGAASTNWDPSADVSYGAGGTLTQTDELLTTQTEELMYTIEVTVYKNPEYDVSAKTISGTEILTLEGTKIDW